MKGQGKITLRGCPFCGKTQSVKMDGISETGQCWVCCTGAGGCGAIGPDAHSQTSAVRKWNRRSGRPRRGPAEGG
jgi:hypothetical protein